MLQLLLFLIPLLIACGWWLGYRHGKTIVGSGYAHDTTHVAPDYFLGLNYLLNDEPDKAVDIFIKMFEVNSNTIETHLALGNLFRRRGEIDRAIRIHQNLIARPQLVAAYRTQALFELAEDYLRAGVLDRAERLFQDLLQGGGDMVLSLRGLLDIYQQQKDWQQAITTAQKIAKLTGVDVRHEVAHYCCELAEQANNNTAPAQVEKYLQTALAQNKNCVRANIILGKLLFKAGEYRRALDTFQSIYMQDADYIAEVIAYVVTSYKKLGLETELVSYLEQRIKESPRIYYILAMSDYLFTSNSLQVAIDYLTVQLSRCPSLRGLTKLLELCLLQEAACLHTQLILVQEVIVKNLSKKPIYRCINCGFAGKNLYWQCPSCKRWSTVKPIHGLEGD
jgi:Predicted N-acetylglucosaminyl transferase